MGSWPEWQTGRRPGRFSAGGALDALANAMQERPGVQAGVNAEVPAPTLEPPPESWLDPRVTVGPSAVEGLGLFATHSIAGGETVAVLGGRVIGDAEVRALIASGHRYDGIALGDDRNLAIRPTDWPGRHGNHSCDPNLWMAGSVRVVAARDIKPGEELTSDYALHTTAPSWQMTCHCGSQLCRGTIRGDDWRLPALQKRYRGHWPPALARLIAASATAKPPKESRAGHAFKLE